MKVTSGRFERQDAKFRGWAELPAAGRYHLYVAPACPWSHRAVIALRLKGLEDEVGVSQLHPYRDERGWAFAGDGFSDPVNGWEYLADAYERTEPGYTTHDSLNPKRIIPAGPLDLDWTAPHGR